MVRNLVPDLIRIVDDDPSVCASLTFILQIAVFDVVSYNSADQFLEQATDLRPGCVLLDVKMPGKSGLELFCDIRRQGMLLPVIFLSGHGDIEMAVQALHDGAFDFLVKPAEPERLIEKVQKAVEYGKKIRSQAQEQEEIKTELNLGQKPLRVQVLKVSEQAIKAHRSSIYHKLDVINPVEVAGVVNDWLRSRKV